MVTPEEAIKAANWLDEFWTNPIACRASFAPKVEDCAAKLRDLAAQVEALQADAARYQYMRDNDCTEFYCSWIDELLNMPEADSDEFDAAIDEVRKKS